MDDSYKRIGSSLDFQGISEAQFEDLNNDKYPDLVLLTFVDPNDPNSAGNPAITIVFNDNKGNFQSKVIFGGEAPGKNEDKKGEPFIGIAGKKLSMALEEAGISREEVYITNIVKFFLSSHNKCIKNNATILAFVPAINNATTIFKNPKSTYDTHTVTAVKKNNIPATRK